MKKTKSCLDCNTNKYFDDEYQECTYCDENFCPDCIDEHEFSCVHNPNPMMEVI